MPPSKPRDAREFVRVAVTLASDPKLLDTTDVPRCGWLYVCGLTYSREHKTDGVLLPAAVVREAGVPRKLVAELVRVGMWHEPGHDCPRCQQPPDRALIVHDFLEHQQSREESAAARAKAKAAADARWSARAVTDRHAKSNARSNASSNAQGNASSNAEAEVEVEREVEENPYLLTLVSRLAAGTARGSQPPAEVVDAWQDLAGPTINLEAEAAAYLRRFGDRPADDERGAWLGWLTKARQRTERTDAATRPTPIPATPHCPIHPEHPTGSKACPRCLAEATPADDVAARTEQLRAALRRPTEQEIPA